MHRRRFLELTALSATAATSTTLAGCTGSAGAGAGGDSGTTTTRTTTEDDSGPHPTTTVLPCPKVRDVSLHVCPDDEDGPITVTRSSREMSPDGGSLTVTVENTSDATVGLNPYAWSVHRLNDDGHWERVDDRAHIEPWEQLAPGDTRRWRITSDTDSSGSDDAVECSLDLEPGTYGWTVELKPGEQGDRIAAAAGFYVR